MTHARRPFLFLSSGLTIQRDRERNERLANRLEQQVDVYLPQRDGGLLIDMLKNGVDWELAATRVFRADTEALRSCDIVLAVLPEGFVGAGVCFELGLALALNKACWGFVEAKVERPRSPLIEVSLARIFTDEDELMQEIAVWKSQRLEPNLQE